GDRRWCDVLDAGEITGGAGLQEVIGVVAVERQRDRADFAAVGGQERQRRAELGTGVVVVQRVPGCLPDTRLTEGDGRLAGAGIVDGGDVWPQLAEPGREQVGVAGVEGIWWQPGEGLAGLEAVGDG